MRSVIIFKDTKKWWHEIPDVDLLNARLAELESEQHKIISVAANTNLLGMICSFTILVESIDA